MELNSYFSLEVYFKCMHKDESDFVSALGKAPEIPFYSGISQFLAAVNLL